jgi:hypothetical protein
MSRTIQFKRRQASEIANTVGANGEIIIDITNNTVTVHDGVTPGGHALPNDAYIDGKIADLVDGAPGLLDTLKELADAINDDPNFFSNVQSSITTANANMKLYVDGQIANVSSNTGGAILVAQAAYNQGNSTAVYANTGITLAQAAFNTANTKANTADLANVAFTGDYNDLTNVPEGYSNSNVALYLASYDGAINFTASPAIISGVGTLSTNEILASGRIVSPTTNLIFDTANSAFNQANDANTLAQAAFDAANSAVITGNISIAATNSAINFVANSSGDGYGYSTIELRPDTNAYGDAYLIIDPTAPNHIHIRAGGIQDESYSELFLGGENSHFKVGSGSNPTVYIASNNYFWTFGTDGNLTLPVSGDILDSNGDSVLSGSANTGDWAFIGNVAYNGTNFDQGLYVAPGGESTSYVYVPGNSESANTPIRIINSSSEWNFNANGILMLPADGDIVDSNGQSVLGGGNDSAAAFILVVDPLGDNNTANGSITKPFATIQAAHDYAANNVTSTNPVVIQVNPGRYTENITLTRALTHIVGLTAGAAKSTRIVGSITVNLIAPVLGGTSNDIFSVENLVVSGNVVTLSGDQSYMFLAKNVLFTTSESTGNNLKSTNTSNTGIKIELTDCLFENQNSSDVSIDLSNVWYGNFNQLACYSGSNSVMKISNSNVIMFNSRLTTATGNNVIEAVSGFNSGVSLIGGSLVIINSKANGNGVNISSGATVNIVNSAFQVGTSAGTGRAVFGVSGSTFVNGTNTIIFGTNAKRSTAITNVPHTTTFTSA